MNRLPLPHARIRPHADHLDAAAYLGLPDAARAEGPFTPERLDSHLVSAHVPLRLACADASGHPLVLSLWYVWLEGALWCATSPRARVLNLLRREPRCGFEVAGDAPPYRGVRGQGRAHLHPERGAEILAVLVDHYLGTRDSQFARWLLGRGAPEVAIRIEPRLLVWHLPAAPYGV